MVTGAFVAYYRVSTDRQGRSGLGLDGQRQAVRDFLNGGAWSLLAEFTEVESGRRNDRPELAKHIMAAMAEHEARAISERTRAALQAAKARGRKLGWSIPARRQEQVQASLHGATRTRQEADRFAANILPIIRAIERAGVRTLEGIADALNARGVRAARGGRWYPMTVKNIVDRARRLEA